MFRTSVLRRAAGAFTLVELLVTLAIISVLTGFVSQIYLGARANTRAARCVANQSQVSQALLCFYNDHARFPYDDMTEDLAFQLRPYIPWPAHLHDVALPGVYKCPNDREGRLSNSYEPYYVRRKAPACSGSFVLGCPRHDDTASDSINLSGLGGPSTARRGTMTVSGETVSAEAAAGARSTRTGSMSFDDGSMVTVTSTSADYSVTAVTSFNMADGRLYTIVRVTGTGESDFAVTPGSKFEVVTPVAIIGVRGTRFVVTTCENYACINLLSGTVEVWDRLAEKTRVVTAPATVYVGPVPPPPPNFDYMCIHCKSHCRDGEHCKRCPLHVDKPQNIGTYLCVECPRHCDPDDILVVDGDHCKGFCPMHKDNAIDDNLWVSP